MEDRTLVKTGAIGAAVALCCFTLALIILLGVAGVSASLAWLDYVLLPMLVLFLGMTVYGLILIQRQRGAKA